MSERQRLNEAMRAWSNTLSQEDVEGDPWDIAHLAFIAGRDYERAARAGEIAAAIHEVEQSTQQWATLTRTRQAADAEIERLKSALEELIAEIGSDWPDSWDARVYDAAVCALASPAPSAGEEPD